MSNQPSERRTEERKPAQGPVRIWLDSQPLSLSGRLLDFSSSGFRVAHEHTGMPTGEEVRFQHPVARGRARIVWNRILAEHVETGFLVLP